MPMDRRLNGATMVDCGSGASTRGRARPTDGPRAPPALARAPRSAWMSWAMSCCGIYLVRQLLKQTAVQSTLNAWLVQPMYGVVRRSLQGHPQSWWPAQCSACLGDPTI